MVRREASFLRELMFPKALKAFLMLNSDGAGSGTIVATEKCNNVPCGMPASTVIVADELLALRNGVVTPLVLGYRDMIIQNRECVYTIPWTWRIYSAHRPSAGLSVTEPEVMPSLLSLSQQVAANNLRQ